VGGGRRTGGGELGEATWLNISRACLAHHSTQKLPHQDRDEEGTRETREEGHAERLQEKPVA
jgi:hypothetical protein